MPEGNQKHGRRHEGRESSLPAAAAQPLSIRPHTHAPVPALQWAIRMLIGVVNRSKDRTQSNIYWIVGSSRGAVGGGGDGREECALPSRCERTPAKTPHAHAQHDAPVASDDKRPPHVTVREVAIVADLRGRAEEVPESGAGARPWCVRAWRPLLRARALASVHYLICLITAPRRNGTAVI